MRSTLRGQLAGGDRRSIGQVPIVLRRLSHHPRLIAGLVDTLNDIDPIVRMRAADALEKATVTDPSSLHPFRNGLLRLASTTDQQELRWHLAQIMPRLRITARQRSKCVQTLRRYLEDRSSIVRTCALQALVEFAARDPRLRRRVDAIITQALLTGTPAMRARARRILARRKRW